MARSCGRSSSRSARSTKPARTAAQYASSLCSSNAPSWKSGTSVKLPNACTRFSRTATIPARSVLPTPPIPTTIRPVFMRENSCCSRCAIVLKGASHDQGQENPAAQGRRRQEVQHRRLQARLPGEGLLLLPLRQVEGRRVAQGPLQDLQQGRLPQEGGRPRPLRRPPAQEGRRSPR